MSPQRLGFESPNSELKKGPQCFEMMFLKATNLSFAFLLLPMPGDCFECFEGLEGKHTVCLDRSVFKD